MESGFRILSAIQGLRQPWLDQVMLFFSQLGDNGLLWVVLSLLFLAYKPTRRTGVLCLLSLLLSLILCNLTIKPLVHRLRPYQVRDLELLVEPSIDTSFPSGHASSSFAWAFCLTTQGWKAALPGYLAAALVSFSRLYLQVHFPGDVIGGALLGTLCAIVVMWTWNRLARARAGKEGR